MPSTGRPQNTTPTYPGTPTVINGSVDATGTQVLAAGPRIWGAWIQNVDGTAVDTLKVGTVTGDCVILLASAGNAVNTPNAMFWPGQGPVFLKSTNGTLTTDYAITYM